MQSKCKVGQRKARQIKDRFEAKQGRVKAMTGHRSDRRTTRQEQNIASQRAGKKGKCNGKRAYRGRAKERQKTGQKQARTNAGQRQVTGNAEERKVRGIVMADERARENNGEEGHRSGVVRKWQIKVRAKIRNSKGKAG